ncbi:hypothetical protein [Ferruginibacter sp. SUN106]|uniref:hypothetical protein n=1 Tax=Ferruginibacter sp. SUN106 TaxID=2978348 RepID=UPI003D365EDD
MPKFAHLIFLLFFLQLFSCTQTATKARIINPTWTKRNLPNGWSIYLPVAFKDSVLHGIDSQPGYIVSKADSILLNYDSDRERTLKGKLNYDPCDFAYQVKMAKETIQNDEQDYFHEANKLYHLKLDTIDGKVAIIRTPIIKGQQRVEIQIRDCKSESCLSIYGQNFSAQQEQLVLEIFSTLSFHDK